MAKHNILVTGGAGFIGSHLVDALVALGHRVRVLDVIAPQVHVTGEPQYLNPEAEFIRGDVCDDAAVEKAVEGVDVVYHQAAEVGVGQSMYEIQKYVRANDLGTAVLLEALVKRRSQIRKLIVASSMSIYGEGAYRNAGGEIVYPAIRPASQLIERRWELLCPRTGEVLTPLGTAEEKPLVPTWAYGVPTVALRYFNVYGTRQALSNPYTGVCAIFSSRLLNDQSPVIFEDGEQTRDFVHVSDIVQANLLALETDRADYQAVNVGTGRATSVKQVMKMLAEGLGKRIEPEITGKYREGDIRHCVADITRARALLSYEPKVSIEQGIPELLEWVRRQESSDKVAEATAALESLQLVK